MAHPRGNEKQGSRPEKQPGTFSKGYTQLPYDPAIPLLGLHTQEK